MVAAIIAGGTALASGIGSAVSSSSAAGVQSDAARQAIALQQSMFDTTQNNLTPFIGAGINAISPYYNLLSRLNLPQALSGVTPPSPTTTSSMTPPTPTQNTFDLNSYQRANGQAPFNAQPFTTPSGIPTFDFSRNPAPGAITTPTTGLVNPTTTPSTVPSSFDYQRWGLGANQQKALEDTPGYQFTREQGLRGVANQEAAKGRGVSGNELAGAGAYTTGLANTTFNQQLQNALQSQGQSFGQTLQGQGQEFGQGLSSAQQLLAAQNQAYGQRASSYGQGLLGQAQSFNQPLQLQNQSWNQLLQGQGQGYNQAYGNINQQMGLNQLAYNQLLPSFTAGLAGQQQAFAQPMQSFYGGLAGQGQGYTQGYQNALAPFSLYQPLINTGLQGAIGGGNIATNVGSNLTGLTTGAGAAQAGGIVGAGNALTGAGNNIANQLILNQLLNPSGGSIAQPNTQNTGLPF